MDRSRKYGFATALHPKKGLLVGWLFKSEEFPWVQSWENYPANKKMARGLEFSTIPFDLPRRVAAEMHGMLGGPATRWLPAKSALETSFLIFYTRAPQGMERVDDIRLESGNLVIEDKKAGKKISLAASLAL
jgi:hypothetical protein